MLTDKFRIILGREDKKELIPFLRSLSKEDKKEFNTSFKDLTKEYLEYKQVSGMLGVTLKRKATESQQEIITAAAFVFMNRRDFEKLDEFTNMLRNPFLFTILEWYCPDWFNNYVHNILKQEWFPYFVDYELIMKLTDKGYLQPTDELVARTLPQAVIDHELDKSNNNKFYYRPENLFKRPITLEKHIWLLFSYESNVEVAGAQMSFQNLEKSDKGVWSRIFKQLVNDNKIDRLRVLRESVLAPSRNVNKMASGWFVDLFETLEPTKAELISLQSEFFLALNSPHSKAINMVLSSLKQFVDSPEFDASKLMENLPLLLASETKSIVNSTLTLLEKVIRNQPGRKEEVCIAMCQAFIHSDETIQSKAARLLLKHHNNSGAVADEINKYRDSMLMSARKSLAALITAGTTAPAETNGTAESVNLYEVSPLPEIKTLDELVFLSSQAFDNNDPMHIDLLAAAFVSLQDELTGSALSKFEPALQRACNLQINGNSACGYLDYLLAAFFIDLMKLLISRDPKAGESLQKVYDHFRNIENENKKKWVWYERKLLPFSSWRVYTHDTTYNIHKALLSNAYNQIAGRQKLPLLSTPTHEHGYVDPVVLVERLSQYQSASVAPGDFDYQVALSRVAIIHHEEALAKAKAVLKNEDLRIIEFLLTKNSKPVGPFLNPVVWFVAGVTKSPGHSYPEFKDFDYLKISPTRFTGDVPWTTVEKIRIESRYNFEKKKSEDIEIIEHVLQLDWPLRHMLAPPSEDTGLLSKISNWFSNKKQERKSAVEVPIIYEELSMKGKFISAEQNDIQRFIYLFPNNPNPLLALVTQAALVYSKPAGDPGTRMLTNTLEALVKLPLRYSEITHLFVASCMLSSDKTVRSFAAEMWSKGVYMKSVDSSLAGKIIGIQVAGEYAPLKRFTDLVSSNLIQVSTSHNQSLEIMLASMLMQLPAEPPTGMKRLLELFSETIALNGSSITDDQLKTKLNSWASSASLKKIISSIT